MGYFSTILNSTGTGMIGIIKRWFSDNDIVFRSGFFDNPAECEKINISSYKDGRINIFSNSQPNGRARINLLFSKNKVPEYIKLGDCYGISFNLPGSSVMSPDQYPLSCHSATVSEHENDLEYRGRIHTALHFVGGKLNTKESQIKIKNIDIETDLDHRSNLNRLGISNFSIVFFSCNLDINTFKNIKVKSINGAKTIIEINGIGALRLYNKIVALERRLGKKAANVFMKEQFGNIENLLYINLYSQQQNYYIHFDNNPETYRIEKRF